MNSNIKGLFYIAFGASSYGVLATFVKYANNNGFGTGGLTFSQYLFGALLLSIVSVFYPHKSKSSTKNVVVSKHPKLKLILFGTTLGLTSSFYYLSIQYVPVSVGIILLMQTIWMGVVLEFFIARELINKIKIIGAMVAIAGTALAAKVFETDLNINFTGIGFGLLAALSYTGAMYASNKVSLELPIITRSKYLVYGGLLVVILFWNVQILNEFNWLLFLKWGAFLGLFGTILPPILFNKGFPEIGTGVGSIIASIEIPVSVFSAYVILQEEISVLQWVGIVIILFSVVLINLKKVKKSD
ncbi:putative permease, DMT superfamily [Galbibacter orientalis DSM 19592]|uniref:Putative permease, DMT superfamily n=1 Tax=Galbibacter orientalis DSM 19592 TaxID=926559 RepID=I3C0E7_9FLAO|nr:EamA family transporter [Galbibacter orientalis]EIJ37090.1 putative permease, DMT superfamily [Galbibacter orientalis DSM 19592]